jgi:thiamine biosynthesis lipoprotein
MFFGKWQALGSQIEIYLPDASDPPAGGEREAHIREYLSGFENRFSRFIETSELRRLNANSGRTMHVSEEMVGLLLAAKKLFLETQGIFNPFILPDLERAGYKESFSEEKNTHSVIEADGDIYSADDDRHDFNFGDVEIDKNAGTVRIPSGARMDLGGIGKGFAVDHITEYLKRYYQNFWISAGGDMRLAGSNNGVDWRVGVQDPSRHNEDICDIVIGDKLTAVATSGTTKRRFGKMNGHEMHHIIDPRTGAPAENAILAVTVLADTAMRADVLAKTALILGDKNGIELIDGLRDAECLMIDKDKKIYYSAGMSQMIKNK